MSVFLIEVVLQQISCNMPVTPHSYSRHDTTRSTTITVVPRKVIQTIVTTMEKCSISSDISCYHIEWYVKLHFKRIFQGISFKGTLQMIDLFKETFHISNDISIAISCVKRLMGIYYFIESKKLTRQKQCCFK